MTKLVKEHFHRQQLAKAKSYIRNHYRDKVSLEEVAKNSGASHYHFSRLFSAYFGESLFSFLRRERILRSFVLLAEEKSVTEIALSVGFESPSSFNKAFKKVSMMSPSDFRNLGKAQQEKLQYDIQVGPKAKEIMMNINMEMKPEVVSREETIVYGIAAKDSSFNDAAQIAWQEFLQVVPTLKEDLSQSEFLGVGEILNNNCSYMAAISIPTNKNPEIGKLVKQTIPAARYAKFLLKGSYEGIWYAFDKAFKFINESEFEIGEAPALELYLNDPSITPEEELLTEILIPIK